MERILQVIVTLALLAPTYVLAEKDSTVPTTATIAEIMHDIVMPAADALWDATTFYMTEEGLLDHTPKNDQEWDKVQQARIVLSKAVEALLIPGRRVDVPGVVSDYPEEDLSPDQIQALIKREPEQWMALAHALESTTQQAKMAIENQDVEALTEIGGAIDDACEGCHLHFWYPEQ